mgnify:CR=1 FL=1
MFSKTLNTLTLHICILLFGVAMATTRKIGARKIQKAFWFTEEEAALLAGLADALGVSEADAVRHSLRFFAAGTYIPNMEVVSGAAPLGVTRSKQGRPKKERLSQTI